MKSKLFPKKQPNIPAAKRNIKGQLITNHAELKQFYLDHFKFRILPKFKDFEIQTETEFRNILSKTNFFFAGLDRTRIGQSSKMSETKAKSRFERVGQ